MVFFINFVVQYAIIFIEETPYICKMKHISTIVMRKYNLDDILAHRLDLSTLRINSAGILNKMQS